MAVSSSIVLALSIFATVLAVVRLVRLHALLDREQRLLLVDDQPGDVFAFATHYFFAVFVVCLLSTAAQSSVFLDLSGRAHYDSMRLACFATLLLTTLLFLL